MRYTRMTRSIFVAMLWACNCVPSMAGMEIAADYSAKTASSSIIGRNNNAALSPALKQSTIIAQANVLFGKQEPGKIAIDIKPDSSDNIVRAGAWRVLPVAILGSEELDVTSINPRTIRLNGVDIMLVGKSDKSLCVEKDINGDSYKDLLCDVRSTGFKIDEGEYTIIIKAGTYNGESLTGEDRIKIVRD